MVSVRRRPFLDTNVIFSGWYRSDSVPATILEWHASGALQAVVSQLVLVELVRTFTRKTPQLLRPFREAFEQRPFEVWQDPPTARVVGFTQLLPPADAVILAAAVESGADCLVTGNTRDFTDRVADIAGFEILTPRRYVERYPQPG